MKKETIFLVALVMAFMLSAEKPVENKSTTGTEIEKENKNTPAITTTTTVNEKPSIPAATQQVSEMRVGKAVIALDIVDRVPQDSGTIFPAEVKRLYCFSEILNGEGGEIQHRWYWNDDLLNSVSLKIGSNKFRTYSAKTILPHMKGRWRVAIVNSTNETTLKWLEFTIE